MASVIFQGLVLDQTLRVVDLGVGANPRVVVELRGAADAMGGRGWSPMDPLSRATFEALLIAAHVIT